MLVTIVRFIKFTKFERVGILENTLLVWLNIALKPMAEQIVKTALDRNYGIEEQDMKLLDGGFEFVFDDETGGNAMIEFIDDSPYLTIKVTADFGWEAVELYKLISGCFTDEETEE